MQPTICHECEHFNGVGSGYSCAAFPRGIPEAIWETNKHDKPLKNQKNSLVFKKMKDPK
jgi:hypothetical protein